MVAVRRRKWEGDVEAEDADLAWGSRELVCLCRRRMCGNTGRLTYGDELLVVLLFASEVVGRHSGKGEEFWGGHVAGWRGGAPLPFEHLAGAPLAFSLVWLGKDERFLFDCAKVLE